MTHSETDLLDPIYAHLATYYEDLVRKGSSRWASMPELMRRLGGKPYAPMFPTFTRHGMFNLVAPVEEGQFAYRDSKAGIGIGPREAGGYGIRYWGSDATSGTCHCPDADSAERLIDAFALRLFLLYVPT